MKYIISSIIITCLFFSSFSQIPNPGFENWTNGTCVLYSYKTPNSWGTINSPTCLLGQFVVEQTNDAHSGSYAIKLITKFLAGRTAPGLAVTGTINTSTEMTEGGFTYTSRPDMLTGWFKHAPVNTDTSSVSLVLWRRNGGVYEKVGEAAFETPVTVSTYSRFTAPITYTSSSNPDSAKIELLSSYESSGQTGSAFIVDDLQFVSCNGLSVSLSTTDVSTVGGADGTATATPSGGTAPYNYYWTPSAQATQFIVNLAPGSYCVTVGDANGCTATTACGAVTEPDCSGFSISVTTTDATTQGGADGTATVQITGATGSTNVSWSTSDTTITILGLSSGTYCVTVTDGVGCSASDCEVVSDPSCTGFSVSLTKTDVSVVGGSDGEITATPLGGTPPYTYVWSGGSNGQNLPAGNYCVTVSDDAGCQDIQCIDILEPSCSGFSVSATGTDPNTVNGSDGTASALPTGGVSPYSYAWTNGDTSQNLTGISAGEYCVTVTDAVGCTVEDCVTISDPDCSGFSVSVTTTDETSAGANDGTASANAIGSVSYLWSNGSTDQNLTALSPNLYCVTATDGRGCNATGCDSVNSGPVGIVDLESAGINLFPNPANDQITIELENSSDYRFRLFDVTGKMVIEKIVSTKSSVISLADIPSGNYLLELKNLVDGNVMTGKLMKE